MNVQTDIRPLFLDPWLQHLYPWISCEKVLDEMHTTHSSGLLSSKGISHLKHFDLIKKLVSQFELSFRQNYPSASVSESFWAHLRFFSSCFFFLFVCLFVCFCFFCLVLSLFSFVQSLLPF